MGKKERSPRINRSEDSKKCSNCFACKKDTELCPLNENYSPDAYLRWEAEYLRRRREDSENNSEKVDG